jgi:acyl-CoA dehydrogenase
VTVSAPAGATVDAARRVATSVARPAADAVDREGRFPHEAFAALRDERLLSALVPSDLGGRGASLREVLECCEALARACASTAMIFAMHQIEVACIVRHHGVSPFFRDYLAGLARHEWLIASATSEVGTGGDLRRSICAITPDGARFHVSKQAPVVSYGEEADDILLTARRQPDAAPGDQVLVLLRKGDTILTRSGDWDALGMRGTRSFGFIVESSATPHQILSTPFADIATRTMVPVSHLLWSAVWLGLASDAVSRARAFVRAEARRSPGVVPPGAFRLAEAVAELGTLRATVRGGLAEVERAEADTGVAGTVGFAIRMNTLKVSAAQMAPDIVGCALGVCGISGYRNDSAYSVGRHLRDAHSAPLMISNDRILSANAAMLLVHKED